MVSRAPKCNEKASKRLPKCIQKASKSHPKGVQKPSKSIKKASKFMTIRSHWNQNSEVPMQRPAENSKEPCTPSDLTKRRVTSRCGGVASAFSIELIVPYVYHYSLKTIRGLTRTALRVSCGSPRPDLQADASAADLS